MAIVMASRVPWPIQGPLNMTWPSMDRLWHIMDGPLMIPDMPWPYRGNAMLRHGNAMADFMVCHGVANAMARDMACLANAKHPKVEKRWK